MTKRQKEALKYVRENMDADDMAILQAEINKSYKQHLVPDEHTVDCDNLIDLLEEYGEENGLPGDWWEEYGEISDWLTWL